MNRTQISVLGRRVANFAIYYEKGVRPLGAPTSPALLWYVTPLGFRPKLNCGLQGFALRTFFKGYLDIDPGTFDKGLELVVFGVSCHFGWVLSLLLAGRGSYLSVGSHFDAPPATVNGRQDPDNLNLGRNSPRIFLHQGGGNTATLRVI